MDNEPEVTATVYTDNSGEDKLLGRNDLLMAKVEVASGDAVDVPTAMNLIGKSRDAWTGTKAEKTAYPPVTLNKLVERSSLLRPNIEGMVMGVHGHGFRIEPIVDLTDDNIEQQVEDAILLERDADREAAIQALIDGEDELSPEEAEKQVPFDAKVSEGEIKERIDQLKWEIARQMFRCRTWFRESGVDKPWADIVKDMWRDREAIGHGAWEFTRNSRGAITRVTYIPGHTIFPVTNSSAWVEAEGRQQVSPIATAPAPVLHRFRTFVQVIGSKKVYFKELGDPRAMSGHSGKVFKDMDEMEAKEKEHAVAAGEVLYFAIHSPSTEAGVPRYTGNIQNVLGQLEAEDTTMMYFANKSVPVGAWVVEGGILTDEVSKSIVDQTRNMVKGTKNFSNVMIITVATPRSMEGTNQRPRVQFIDLMNMNKDDAGWIKYGRDNRDKVGSSFRQPPLMRGEAPSDLTRANAYASIEFTDTYNYSPERLSFDWIMNERLLPDLGYDLVKYVTNSPVTTDPEMISKIMEVGGKYGGLTPNDERKISADALNLDMNPIEEEWGNQPLAMTLAGLIQEAQGDDEETVKFSLGAISDLLGEMLDQRGITATSIQSVDDLTDDIHTPHDGDQ